MGSVLESRSGWGVRCSGRCCTVVVGCCWPLTQLAQLDGANDHSYFLSPPASPSSSPSSNHSPLVVILYPLHSPHTTLGQHTPPKLACTPVPPPSLSPRSEPAPKNSHLVV